MYDVILIVGVIGPHTTDGGRSSGIDREISFLSSHSLTDNSPLCTQEKAGCKMQMIQDGPYANTPEKPLRMTGAPENCKVGRPLANNLGNCCHGFGHVISEFVGVFRAF